MNKKTITDIDVKGKKCLVRVDFNVPMKDGVITDENRIIGALPTIKYLMEHGAKVVLCSHMGKPHNVFDDKIKLNKKEKAKIEALPEEERAAATAEAIEKAKKDVKKFSLAPVAARLNELLDNKVTFATDVIGPDANEKVAALKDGECVLLENLRFHAGEEGRDENFCKALAEYADVYVNDAFGTAHRSHASTAAIVEYGFVKTAVCGFLIEKELSVMADSLEHPVHPFIAILGGAKIADKLNVINNLLDKCDALIIGGGMAYTFFRALGSNTGTSLCEEDKLELALGLMEKARKKGVNFIIPVDNIVGREYDENTQFMRIYSDAIPDGCMGLDIGPTTQELFAKTLVGAGTIIWNGPMGVSEWKNFASGTESVAKAVTE